MKLLYKGSAIILAGGKSSRMGMDKALLKLNNLTLIVGALEKIRVLFDEIIIVTSQSVKYNFKGIKEVVDIFPGQGPLGGIHAGLKTAKYEKAFVVACDMPFWEPDIVKRLWDAATDYDAAVPKKDSFLEPLFAVYSKACLPAIEECFKQNLLSVFDFYQSVKINYVEKDDLLSFTNSKRAFLNINTPEEYYKITNQDPCNLSVEEARALLFQHVQTCDMEDLPLFDALNRVVSKDLVAPRDIPDFKRSSVDGYAVCSRDIEKAKIKTPIRLKILGKVAAGFLPYYEISSGTSVKVMTGAMLPVGTDVVIKYEKVDVDGSDILVFNPEKIGTGVLKAGAECTAGELIAR